MFRCVCQRSKSPTVLWVAFGVLLGLLLGWWLGSQRGVETHSTHSWAQLYDKVKPSVVVVEFDGPVGRVGTGFAVSAHEVVTARHLVVGAEAVRVRRADGGMWQAEVVGTDARTDLALLRIKGSMEPAHLGSSRTLKVGDPVVALGNPFGLGLSLSTGVVSQGARRLVPTANGPRVDFLQLSIPLNPGNSGGPVFDADGRVVGVLAGTHTQGQAIAFAVPVEVVHEDLEPLRRGEHISRAFLGLRASAYDGALVVDSVVPSGPADRAGIRPGDAISALAGAAMSTEADMFAQLDVLPGGRTIEVRLLRDGQLVVVDLALGDWAEQPVVIAGMTLRAAPGSGGEVMAVRPRSRSEASGVRVGDRVQRVNGLPVRAPIEVREALGRTPGAQLEIARDGAAVVVQLKR